MKIVAFDLDGTLLTHNSSFAFCRYLHKKGVLTTSDLFFCAFTYFRHLFLGLSLFELHRSVFRRVFRGKKAESLAHHVPDFIKTLRWYAPAVETLKKWQEEGASVHILSNTPAFLVQPIASTLHVEHVFATEYAIDKGGRLSDIATVVDGEKKRLYLQELEGKSIAFSDSHHDLPFLEAAGEAIVVNPNRKLRKIASKRRWETL